MNIQKIVGIGLIAVGLLNLGYAIGIYTNEILEDDTSFLIYGGLGWFLIAVGLYVGFKDASLWSYTEKEES